MTGVIQHSLPGFAESRRLHGTRQRPQVRLSESRTTQPRFVRPADGVSGLRAHGPAKVTQSVAEPSGMGPAKCSPSARQSAFGRGPWHRRLPVLIEVDVSNGLPQYNVVGLPDSAVKGGCPGPGGARECRVRSAAPSRQCQPRPCGHPQRRRSLRSADRPCDARCVRSPACRGP